MPDPVGLAQDLGGFVAAMRRIDTAGGPIAARDGSRGVPLARRDAATREAIAQLDGVVDSPAVTAAWDATVRAPKWQRPGVWIHGDLLPGNVLVEGRGRLSAVIDFGCMAVEDPAYDAMAVWTLFEADGREAFRSAIEVDDATWARGRGWALVRADRPALLHAHQPRVRTRCPARDPRGAGPRRDVGISPSRTPYLATYRDGSSMSAMRRCLMIMELGLVLILVFVITFRSMQRRAAAVAGEAGTVAAGTTGESQSRARMAASLSLACALLLPASLLLPPIPFHLEFQAPFAGIVLGALAIVRLGNRFGSRWQVVARLGVGLSITWILVVFAALALMLSE